MYCDLPIIKRCFFCLPLRPSIIAWVYFKMIGVLILIYYLSLFLSDVIARRASSCTTCIVMYSQALLLLVVDEIFGIIFLWAVHKKNSKLMQLCSYYNVFLFIASNVIMIVVMSATDVIYTTSGGISGFYLQMGLIILILNFVLQIYIALAIRSEILKLNHDNDEENTYVTMTRNVDKDLPPLSQLQDLPPLPQLQDLPPLPQLQDLPPLPQLQDLPPLPQLQDLQLLTNHVISEPTYDYCYADSVDLNRF